MAQILQPYAALIPRPLNQNFPFFSLLSKKKGGGNRLILEEGSEVLHLTQLCFRLIVGHHRDGCSVVGFQALGDGGAIVGVWAALAPPAKAVSHGVC